jgi:hypothetical protein
MGSCVGLQPAVLASRRVDRTQCSMRTARIDRQSCMRSSHASRTRNPEPRVRENRTTESRIKTDSGTVCRKTPSAAHRAPRQRAATYEAYARQSQGQLASNCKPVTADGPSGPRSRREQVPGRPGPRGSRRRREALCFRAQV